MHQHPAEPVSEDGFYSPARYFYGGYFIVPEAVAIEAGEPESRSDGAYRY
ncbi:MAG: hypothetical protein ABIO92_05770 [Chloroflexia bacterium]